MAKKNTCWYMLGGLNYKNGYATSCPQQSDKLHVMEGMQIIKPSEIINSEGFKKHRLDMMSGKWSPGCHLCKNVEEQNAGRSMRMDYEADDSFYDEFTGMIDFKGLNHVEFRFSNACNMACLHCSEVFSSGWMTKLKHYEPDKDDWNHRLIQLTKTMHRAGAYDDLTIDMSMEDMYKIVDDLNANFPNLKKIDFTGGEVLYQKQFIPCLEALSKHPHADQLHISFHTNFNAKFNPEELSKALEPFKYVTIMMSIDSGTNIYSYFRTGDWDVLKDNIRRFKIANTLRNVDLNVVCTTSVYQMMDLENIFESFLTLDIDWIDSSIVYTPDYLNPAILMFDYKDHVLYDIKKTYALIDRIKKERMDNFEESQKMRTWRKGKQIFQDIESAYMALKGIEDYILNHTPQYKHWEAFMVYIKKTDALWKQNFNNHFINYKFIDEKILRKEML
jgi:hypothetical protein